MIGDHTPDDEPAAHGWKAQFTIESERAQEYIELYESLGNEVRIEPLEPARLQDDECSTCLMEDCDRYTVIYTRPKNDEAPS